MNKELCAKIIFAIIVIVGCIFIRFGIEGNGTLLFFGFLFVMAGIIAQVALVFVPLVKAVIDKMKAKQEEEEEDSVGLGIK